VKCYVVASDEEIDSPIVEEPDVLVVMNTPSMDFVPMLKKKGTLLMNTSLISEEPKRGDVAIVKAPVTELAARLEGPQLAGVKDPTIAANSVMFGVYLAVTGEDLIAQTELVKEVFAHFLTDRKAVFIPLNMSAVDRGYGFIAGGESARRFSQKALAS